MNDAELKRVLSESGQPEPHRQAEAWQALRQQMFPPSHHMETRQEHPAWGWWIGSSALAGIALAMAVAWFHQAPVVQSSGIEVAQGNEPGVVATSFYSQKAQANVVWLSGLQYASDSSDNH